MNLDGLANEILSRLTGASGTTSHVYEAPGDAARTWRVIRAYDFPRKGLTTAITVGLSAHTFDDFPDRVELLQSWRGEANDHERFLVAVAETAVLRAVLPAPGVVWRGAAHFAGLPDLEAHLPDALTIFPYLYDDPLTQFRVGGVRVWTLQVVPLRTDEADFIAARSFAAFEELLERDGVSFDDLRRASHIGR